MQKSKFKMQNYGIKHYFRKSSAQALRKYSGQAMLVAILIITAATLAIGLAVATMGSTEVNIGLVSKQSEQAYGLAETCLENTLIRFARGETTPPANFILPSGNCIIEIAGLAPYQITSTAQVGRTRRKIQATVSINNEVLNIESWGESY